MDGLLTLEQAYLAMFLFVKSYYHRKGEPDELALLLGDIQPLSYLLNKTIEGNKEGRILTADPASWHDWLDAVTAMLKEGGQEPHEH